MDSSTSLAAVSSNSTSSCGVEDVLTSPSNISGVDGGSWTVLGKDEMVTAAASGMSASKVGGACGRRLAERRGKTFCQVACTVASCVLEPRRAGQLCLDPGDPRRFNSGHQAQVAE